MLATMASKLWDTLRDARDVLVHTRSPVELVRGFGPRALRAPRVLNDAAAPVGDPDAVTVRLSELRRRLQAEVLADDGRVDYARLREGAPYAALQTTSATLRNAALDFASEAERSAFWINLYNLLTLHGVIALGVRRSVMEMPAFFDRVAYRVGDHVLTLDDLENGILRRNAPHPITGRRPFAPGDPRLALQVAQLDPRIHAALVCAARSCPPIAMYEADRLDAQLDLVSDGFVTAGVELDDAARTVTIPRLFRWYAGDFGGDVGVRGFLIAHNPPEQATALRQAFAAGHAIRHHRYDWRLNSR